MALDSHLRAVRVFFLGVDLWITWHAGLLLVLDWVLDRLKFRRDLGQNGAEIGRF